MTIINVDITNLSDEEKKIKKEKIERFNYWSKFLRNHPAKDNLTLEMIRNERMKKYENGKVLQDISEKLNTTRIVEYPQEYKLSSMLAQKAKKEMMENGVVQTQHNELST